MQVLKQRIFLRWPDRDTGVLFELDGTQANVSNTDFQNNRRADDVDIYITGAMGTVNQYNINIPAPEKAQPTPAS